ncbi:DUF2690 domain-containing protein [Streptomyces sp. NPDC002122]|uniref:DUF2690 domain-containing protein n=1 Tax=Streptomyces sp. NPDC002122 TaxID=3154407 RepID=UPI003327875A
MNAWKPRTRKLATVGSALAVAASSLLLASSPASAATSCYASSCQGLDPATTICQNDAKTVAYGWFHAQELRYSPTCRAVWTRYKTTSGEPITVAVRREDGSATYSTHYAGDGVTVWTRMVNDKDVLSRACVFLLDGTNRYDCSDPY